LDLPLKNVANQLDDLRPVSYKLEEVKRLIAEQEWKIRQSKYDNHLSFLSYVGMATASLAMIILCYCCCCKAHRRRFPNFSKWWQDHTACPTTVMKPKIINSVHSSRESPKISNA